MPDININVGGGPDFILHADVEGDARKAPGEITAGVRGTKPDGEAEGVLGALDPVLSQPVGAYGTSNNLGVVGLSKGPVGAGVFGSASQTGSNFNPATGGTGVLGSGYVGVRGETTTGVAVLGRLFGPGIAGRFEGDVEITGRVEAPKSTITCFDIALAGADCAEEFELSTVEQAQSGSVMSFDENGMLTLSRRAYDRILAVWARTRGDFLIPMSGGSQTAIFKMQSNQP